MLYMVTFTINIPQMLAYIPYMDPMGYICIYIYVYIYIVFVKRPHVFATRPTRLSATRRRWTPSWTTSAQSARHLSVLAPSAEGFCRCICSSDLMGI